MGTTAELNVAPGGMGLSLAKKACDAAETKISTLDAMLSIFNGQGLVSRINKNNKKKVVKVSPELFRLAKRAKEYFVLTQGAFDITVEPLTQIWGFGPEKKTLPEAKAITEVLRYVGLDKIKLDEKSKTFTFKDARVKMDFGAIAKGYAVDEAVKIFKARGIKEGLINIGGDLYCMGAKPGSKSWFIGIRDPENKGNILATLQLHDKAIATSGTYENFYIYNNKRYSHIIDPRTGYPVINNITSATVIADDCTTADALATAVFVLGEHKAVTLIESLPDIECFLIISKDGRSEFIISSGMERYIKRDETQKKSFGRDERRH